MLQITRKRREWVSIGPHQAIRVLETKEHSCRLQFIGRVRGCRTLRVGESVHLGEGFVVLLNADLGKEPMLGLEYPKHIRICRGELKPQGLADELKAELASRELSRQRQQAPSATESRLDASGGSG